VALFTIQVEEKAKLTQVTLSGVVDETADFAPLAELTGAVEIHCGDVRRLNSMGVRLWSDAMRALTQHADVAFVACSRAVVHQISMIGGFLGKGRVASFHAPMRCEVCDYEADHFIDADAYVASGRMPPLACPNGHGPMVLDEIEDIYLQFLST